jgi:gliding motility-associated-like protein
MKKLLLVISIALMATTAKAQCFYIQSILADACNNAPCPNTATEGQNEMTTFVVGTTSLNVANLTINWPSNSFLGIETNTTITTPLVNALNSSIVSCGWLKQPTGGVLPANSTVLVVTSTDMCTSGNSFANLTDTLYIIFQKAGNTSGHFLNYQAASAIRTLSMSFSAPASCSDAVSYDASLLTNISGGHGGTTTQKDGGAIEYSSVGVATYINRGCQAPYIPISITTSAPASACSNGTPTVSAVVSGPAVTYTWVTNGTGILSASTGTLSASAGSTTVTPTYTPGAGETGNVTFTITAQGKCALISATVSNTVSIFINPTPSPTITSSNGTSSIAICNGSSTVLSASNTGTLTTTWGWNPGGASTSTLTVNPPTGTQVYTLTATNSCGTNNATFTVTTNPLPTITIVNDSVCNGGSGSLTASGADTYTWNTGVNGTTISSSNITSNTNFTVTATNTLTSCQNTQVGHIIVRTPPSITTNSLAICQGVETVLTANGGASTSSYSWNPGGPSGSDTYSVTPSNTNPIIVTGTDVFGCTNTNTVTVNAQPVFTINPGGICPGAQTVLTPNPLVNTPTTYSWVPLNITTTNTAPSVTVQPSSTTHYTITSTNPSGCSYTQTDSVVVNNSITITPPTNTLICSGITSTLSVSGASVYTWLASAGAVTPVMTGDFSSVLVNQSGSVTYTVSGTSGSCYNSTVFTVDVAPAFTVASTVSPSASVCPNNTVTLTGSPASTYTYTWSNGVTDGVTFTPVSTQTYTLTGTDVNGCKSTTTQNILVYNIPIVTVSSPPVCAGATATLTASGANTYTWSSTTSGGNASTTTAIPTVNPQTYTVMGTDVNGCISVVATSTIVTNALPVISITSNPVNAIICAGSTITLNGNGASAYTWTGGVINGAVFTPAASPQIQTYTVTGTDGNNCSNVAIQTVTVNPLPLITVNSPSVCLGLSTSLTAGGAVTYTWSTLSIGTTINVSPSGTQTYSVAGTDANGCIGTATTLVLVNQLPTISVTTNPTGNAVCAGTTTTLTASSTSTLAVSFDWDNAGTNQNPNIVSPATQTTYTVVGTDANNCTASQTITININPLPTAQAISGNTFVCVGVMGVATVLSASNNGYWTGPLPSTSTISVNSTTANITKGGVYTLHTVNGCGDAPTSYTVSADSVVASFTANPVIGQTPLSVTFTNTSQGNSLAYGWSFGDSSASINPNPTHIYTDAGIFHAILLANDNLGCKGSASTIITVNDVPSIVVIPNIFSPNGDNINDVFTINATGVTNFDCKVYDRWGLLLHEWAGKDGGWDGKAKNGINCTDGTYFYLITYLDNQSKSNLKNGFFQLIR